LANTTGANNVAVGILALQANTTASNNTAVGYQAGYTGTTSSYNTFIGVQAGYTANLNGNGANTCVGYYSGYALTTGINNQFLGVSAGSAITTGSNHTIIGQYNGNQNGLDIRTNTTGFVVLSTGTGAVMAYSANGSGWYQQNNSTLWAITSDQRIKKNIVDLENGLTTILALKPKEFDYIVTNQHDVGFIAQDFETVLPAQITEQDASGQYADLTGGDKLKGIQQNLVPYLVKAIQELNAKVTALEDKLGA